MGEFGKIWNKSTVAYLKAALVFATSNWMSFSSRSKPRIWEILSRSAKALDNYVFSGWYGQSLISIENSILFNDKSIRNFLPQMISAENFVECMNMSFFFASTIKWVSVVGNLNYHIISCHSTTHFIKLCLIPSRTRWTSFYSIFSTSFCI